MTHHTPPLGQIRYAYISQVLGEHGDGGLSPTLRLGLIRQALRSLSTAQLDQVNDLVRAARQALPEPAHASQA